MKHQSNELIISIGKKLKAIRESRGYTQEYVAIQTDIARKSVILYENGKMKNPGIVTLELLASFYGLTLKDIL